MPTKKARAVGFNHIALEVGDLDEALAFYGRLFDFELRGRDEDAVFIAHLPDPELRTLTELDASMQRCKVQALESKGAFRRILRVSRLPRPLRRLVWWLGLNLSGRLRTRYFGTFVVTSTAALGVGALHVLAPIAPILTYGPLDPDGALDVRLVFDHRVLDGGPIARAMLDLEETLLGPILEELTRLGMAQAA